MKMNAHHEIKNQNDFYFTTGFVMGKLNPPHTSLRTPFSIQID